MSEDSTDYGQSISFDNTMPDIEPDVIRDLARAADALQNAARLSRWDFVQSRCDNALNEIKLAIRAACGSVRP